MEFLAGYNWAALGLDCPKNKSHKWIRGFEQYHADMSRSERVKWV